MIEIQPINLKRDYPLIASWWEQRKLKLIPEGCFLPSDGFMARNGEPLAVSFLYTVPSANGGIGIIEFTTTNPVAKDKKGVLEAVKLLYAYLECVARTRGCGSVMALIVPNGSGEQHIMEEIGYQDVGDGPHRTYAKAIWR